MAIEESKLYCSFCRKSEDDVKKLFPGRKAYICDNCVEVAFSAKGGDETKNVIKHHLLKKE